jgi:hypothetical protein
VGYNGGSCGNLQPNITIPGLKPGNYKLSVKIYDSNVNIPIDLTYLYPTTINQIITKEFYYEGFEESTTPDAITGIAHTGNKYSTNTTINWAKPNGRKYVITYWYRTGGVWKYKDESNYDGPSYTLTGGDAYDDVRIYPQDAQMTTYTSTHPVGMTSVTDPKGITTYYEYDNFLRLKNIKDKNGNIIKQTTYHYQGQ